MKLKLPLIQGNWFQTLSRWATELRSKDFVMRDEDLVQMAGSCPVGTPIPWMNTVIPENHILLDGSSLVKASFPELFNTYDYFYGGSGDFFNIPDLTDFQYPGYWITRYTDTPGSGNDVMDYTSRLVAPTRVTGWTPIRGETWTYASSTTINVPSDATLKFQVGDKIRLDNTSTKYFYVTGVAASLLTVYAGSDYTVANAAISNIYISRVDRPFGFPGKFTYALTWDGYAAGAPPTGAGYFSLSNGFCHVVIGTTADGTSNAVNHKVNAPIACTFLTVIKIGARDNGVNLDHPYGWIQPSVDGGLKFTLGTAPSAGTGAWTAANGKSASFAATYPIV